MRFEVIPENDSDKDRETAYKKKQQNYRVLTYINIIIFAFLLLMNSFSLAYLRYITERGAKAGIGEARVSVYTDGEGILLNEKTPEGKVFSVTTKKDSLTVIKIDIKKTPEAVKLFINGVETDYSAGDYTRVDAYSGPVWKDDYFKIDIYGNIYFNMHEGQNTLELAGGHFYKKWVFVIDY